MGRSKATGGRSRDSSEEFPSSISVDEALRDDGTEIWSPGSPLTNLMANRLAANKRVNVVVLAGGTKSGKTTLITSIYEHYLQEPIGDYLFSGSETLFAFEERCFYNRVDSGRSQPGMKTTGRHDPPWLHLSVRHSQRTHQAENLLLGDISGGWFEGAIEGIVDIKTQLPHLSRADHVLLVLDGAKLADPEQRDVERSGIGVLARLLVEEDVLASTSRLGIVVTKWDKVARAGADAERYADQSVERISTSAGFSESVPTWRVAPRPETGAFPIGHGVPSLFLSWVERSGFQVVRKYGDLPLPSDPFSRFKAAAPSEHWLWS